MAYYTTGILLYNYIFIVEYYKKKLQPFGMNVNWKCMKIVRFESLNTIGMASSQRKMRW